ncbi:MAG: LacI family DNA-binding transcriptional regulator [Pseudomonadota bacterium]
MSTATINDVAREAGVSIKTVSRVLNREPNVRDVTRDAVLAAARALNYQPNLSARSLAGSRSFLIGLFFDNPSPAYVADVQRGAVGRCRESGYHLTIEPVEVEMRDLEDVVFQAVSTLRLDGVILTPPVCDEPRVMSVLESLNTPYVRIAPDDNRGRAPWVGMDDRAAARAMTEHLLELGHRDIGFVTGHPDHGASHLRLEGFQEAMSAAGLRPAPGRIAQGWFSFRSGFEAAERILQAGGRPTAIFASNDDMALGVIAAATRRRLTVPDDLSVAGFDDTPAARTVWPQLTTIGQPILEMAAAAADLLIRGDAREYPRGEPPGRVFDFRLAVRESTSRISG